MKDLKLYVTGKMHDQLKEIEKQGIDIDLFIEDSVKKMLKEFKENPDEILEKFKQIENDYQTEYNIN